jgi:hypothetical protein
MSDRHFFVRAHSTKTIEHVDHPMLSLDSPFGFSVGYQGTGGWFEKESLLEHAVGML